MKEGGCLDLLRYCFVSAEGYATKPCRKEREREREGLKVVKLVLRNR